jgi:hypothetical protein
VEKTEQKSVACFKGIASIIENDTMLQIVGSVYFGLHCYDSKEARREAKRTTIKKIYEAVIPEGTKYIRGEDGEIVALSLKLTGRRFR